MKYSLKLAVFFAVVALCLHAEPIASLHPANYVNDFAGVLDASTQGRLNDLCRQVDQKAHAQIAVVTVKSVDGQDIVSYAVALYQAWGIGPKSSNRGVLILLATQDRTYWTTVGYGLEPILPDGKVGGFGREAVPLLRNGDYNGAVALMTARVASVIAQDAGVTLEGAKAQAPETGYEPRAIRNPGIGSIIGAVVVLVVLLMIIGSALSRAGGGGFGNILLAILWTLLFSGGSGRRGGGFGGGGFGGGGGGFGGFGGGSTGGGGAGGSW